jgi:hypothetical protein
MKRVFRFKPIPQGHAAGGLNPSTACGIWTGHSAQVAPQQSPILCAGNLKQKSKI